MKRGQITEGIVEELRYPDRGRLHADDGTLLEVKNVLPGQRVRVKVTKAGRDPVRAQLCEILAKSPLETEEDPCRHFGR